MTTRAHLSTLVILLCGCLAGMAAAQTTSPPTSSDAAQVAAAANPAPGIRAGSATGAVQMTVFCDVEDEACRRLVVVLGSVVEQYPERVGILFRHHAPPEHERARWAYQAALAAGRQGRGWELLDMACANPDRLDEAGLRSMAAQLGLDTGRFTADLAADAAAQVLRDDEEQAKGLGVTSVPAVFVNGSRMAGPWTFEAFATLMIR